MKQPSEMKITKRNIMPLRLRMLAGMRRLVTPKSLRHMLDFPRNFLSQIGDQGDQYEVRWNGKVITRTIPLNSIRGADTRDCFILATGPCSKLLEPDLIAGQSLIGVNGAYAVTSRLGVDPDYLVISDVHYVLHRFHLVRPLLEKGIKFFCAPEVLLHLCQLDAALVSKVPIGLIFRVNRKNGVPRMMPEVYRDWACDHSDVYLHATGNDGGARVGFSANLTNGVFVRASVGGVALQVAVHLGAKRIFIWGMNMDYSMKDSHVYERKLMPGEAEFGKNICLKGERTFEVARDACRSRGVELYNVCPESRLPSEVIEKISVDQFRKLMREK